MTWAPHCQVKVSLLKHATHWNLSFGGRQSNEHALVRALDFQISPLQNQVELTTKRRSAVTFPGELPTLVMGLTNFIITLKSNLRISKQSQ